MAEKLTKTNVKNSPVTNPYAGVKISKEEHKALVQKALISSMRWYDRKPPKSDEESAQRMLEFFTVCIENGEVPTVEKMALAQGVVRQTLWEWEQGKIGSTRADIVRKGKEMIASYDAEMVAKGKMNPVAYIFRAKNYFGMKDQQDIMVTPKNPMDEVERPEDIAKRLRGAVVIEHED